MAEIVRVLVRRKETAAPVTAPSGSKPEAAGRRPGAMTAANERSAERLTIPARLRGLNIKPIIPGRKFTGRDELLVHHWRVARLTRWGFPDRWPRSL